MKTTNVKERRGGRKVAFTVEKLKPGNFVHLDRATGSPVAAEELIIIIILPAFPCRRKKLIKRSLDATLVAGQLVQE